ncbi:MAG: M48 family metallopeptidase [Fervidobacterium sp.]
MKKCRKNKEISVEENYKGNFIYKLFLDDREITCKVLRNRKRKGSSFKIIASDCSTVHIYFPSNISEQSIINIIEKSSVDIKNLLDKINKKKNELINKIIKGEYYTLYLGTELKVTVLKNTSKPITLIDNELVINESYVEYYEKLINYWLEKRAKEYLPKRVLELSKTTGLRFKKVIIKDVKSRWGSCSQEGVISLNWRLIKAPFSVIDYVIIHELAHTIEMNHSKTFWRIVEKHEPNWKLYRKWLRNNSELCLDNF